MKTKLTAVGLCLMMALSAIATLPVVTAEDKTLIPGEVSGIVEGENIYVPAGTALVATGNTVFHAVENIVIEGVITSLSGVNLEFIAGKDITIGGSIIAGNGYASLPELTEASSGIIVMGTDGTNGGSVRFVSNEGTISILPTGIVASGSGGSGSNSLAYGVGNYSNGVIFEAVGGNGGNAGSMELLADAVNLQGTLIIGSGGNGGNSIALGRGYELVSAVGGEAGESGILNAPTLNVETIASLVDAGIIVGGDGGAGGSALAIGEDLITIVNNPELKATLDNYICETEGTQMLQVLQNLIDSLGKTSDPGDDDDSGIVVPGIDKKAIEQLKKTATGLAVWALGVVMNAVNNPPGKIVVPGDLIPSTNLGKLVAFVNAIVSNSNIGLDGTPGTSDDETGTDGLSSGRDGVNPGDPGTNGDSGTGASAKGGAGGDGHLNGNGGPGGDARAQGGDGKIGGNGASGADGGSAVGWPNCGENGGRGGDGGSGGQAGYATANAGSGGSGAGTGSGGDGGSAFAEGGDAGSGGSGGNGGFGGSGTWGADGGNGGNGGDGGFTWSGGSATANHGYGGGCSAAGHKGSDGQVSAFGGYGGSGGGGGSGGPGGYSSYGTPGIDGCAGTTRTDGSRGYESEN